MTPLDSQFKTLIQETIQEIEHDKKVETDRIKMLIMIQKAISIHKLTGYIQFIDKGELIEKYFPLEQGISIGKDAEFKIQVYKGYCFYKTRIIKGYNISMPISKQDYGVLISISSYLEEEFPKLRIK